MRHDRGDRWSFHRAPMKFNDKHKHVCDMGYSNHEGSKVLQIQPSKKEIKDMGIRNGDEFYPIWEVIKPGHTTSPGVSTHPVPFFRLCDIGPYDNWHYANKVAFKLHWRSRKDGKWKTKYMQRDAQLHFVANCTAPGALVDYSYGVGVYCFFMRCRFPSAQPWTANFGQAKIITLTVNNFQQNITATHMATAGDVLEGPTFNPNVCRVKMEHLGLHRVNAATFKGFDWSWFTNRSVFKGGAMLTPKQLTPYKGRSKCDYCFLSCRSALPPNHKDTLVCTQVGDSNICDPCAKMGRPCSWTGIPYLFGRDDWLEEVKGPGKRDMFGKGELHIAAIKALICQPEQNEAIMSYEMDVTPGVSTVREQLSGSSRVHFNQLSAADQQIYNGWNAAVQVVVTSMGGLQIGSSRYQERMQEVSTLVDQVSTREMSDLLRLYMRRIIERDIYPFMVNGRFPIRGG